LAKIYTKNLWAYNGKVPFFKGFY